jgi:hypothetical protein
MQLMRHLSLPELKLVAGFPISEYFIADEWLTCTAVSVPTLYIFLVLRKQ